MPGNSLEEARFDHVSDTGELVFVSGAGKFAVKVDEALERAILEAKQIRSEVQEEQKTRIPPTLPISQIQSLIRAGADPARVAERYSLSEALVRRFLGFGRNGKAICDRAVSRRSSAEGKPRTHAFRTDRTHFCGSAGALGRCDLEGHQTWMEPWKISAQFVSSGHNVCAEWSWNMHDNAVSCLNSAARKLIGEQDTSKEGHAEKHADENFLVSLNLPGNSARSARIEQTVSAWNTPEPSMPAARPAAAPSVPIAPIGGVSNESDTPDTPNAPAIASDLPLPSRPENPAAGANTASATNTDTRNTVPSTPEPASNMANENQTLDPHSQNTTKSKRRAGRSAVPSWDEIPVWRLKLGHVDQAGNVGFEHGERPVHAWQVHRLFCLRT